MNVKQNLSTKLWHSFKNKNINYITILQTIPLQIVFIKKQTRKKN